MHRRGMNEKALAARERKAAAKAEAHSAAVKAKEDAVWQETDKHALRKETRRNEREEKAFAEMQKRQEKKALEEAEYANTSNKSKKKQGPQKLTRAQIAAKLLLVKVEEDKQREAEAKNYAQALRDDDTLLENVNQAERKAKEEAMEAGIDYVEASGLDAALGALTVGGEVDRNPERRMKAAFKAYEEEWLVLMKEEYPHLKRSQLKERIWKQWQKAPENPMNQQQ